jgi:hypothetical protein
MEFTEFKPEVRYLPPKKIKATDKFQGEWLATGIESGSKFVAIDLTEGEWFDYDEKAGEEVSIKELKWEIRRN